MILKSLDIQMQKTKQIKTKQTKRWLPQNKKKSWSIALDCMQKLIPGES